jgi:hypothetical protein
MTVQDSAASLEVVVNLECHANLFEVIGTRHSVSGFAGFLHGSQR